MQLHSTSTSSSKAKKPNQSPNNSASSGSTSQKSQTTVKPQFRRVNWANVVTMCALFSGTYAMIRAVEGAFIEACAYIALAAILDYLDGRVARMTNSSSDLGAQMDSMADLVSFGVAPVIISYSLASFYQLSTLPFIIASFIYLSACAFRLARFNVGGPRHATYSGVPSPVAAIMMISYIWLIITQHPDSVAAFYVVPILLVGVALLMVSKLVFLKFESLRSVEGQRGSRTTALWSLFVISTVVALLISNPALSLFGLTVGYILSGVLLTLVRFTSIWAAKRRRK